MAWRPEQELPEWLLKSTDLLEQIFNSLPNVLFYIKDTAGRYLCVNDTLVERSGMRDRSTVVGKTSEQLFPVLGLTPFERDMEAVRTQGSIRERLLLYRTFQGETYWCLSSKFALHDDAGRVTGLVGLSRDLPRSNQRHRSYNRLARFLEYIDLRFDQDVRVTDAAKHAALSADTLARLVFEVFHLTPRQMLMKKRIDKACQLLAETGRSITEVSYACGYADHSAFTRQFRLATGITPVTYRATHKSTAAIL